MLNTANLIFIIPIILISMGIHEAIHSYVAHWLGDDTAKEEGRLTLNPLKHIDIYTTLALPVILILLGLPPIFVAKPVPFDPENVKFDEFGAAMIGVAGPLSNLIMATFAALVFRFAPLTAFSAKFLLLFIIINVSFFVFNMIPFPPLDGSRLLYAFSPEPLQKLMLQIEHLGFLAIMLFFFLLVPFLGPLISYLNDAVLGVLLSGIYPL